MQIITMYLRADSVKATLVDAWNQTLSSLPALTRGMRAELVLKLVDTDGNPLADEALGYAAWDFAIANDWDTATAPQIRVTEGVSVTANEVHIPLTETNTEELIAALGTNESATFGCELAGFETGETVPGFLIQFNIVIRNRRADAGTGTPEPVGDGSYSAAQIRALFAASNEVQLSDNGATWYTHSPADATPSSARYYRFRNALVGRDWSEAIPLLVGPRGERATVAVGSVATGSPGTPATVTNSGDEHDAVFDFSIPSGTRGAAAAITVGSVVTGSPGTSASVTNSGDENDAVLDFTIPRGDTGETGTESYLYVAYAAQSDGQGFSLVPNNALKYRAEIVSRVPIDNPALSDFASAQWVKYLGDSTSYQAVLVADPTTSVADVSRIVFENAVIRRGIDGEVIVNFNEAGVANAELNAYAVINGRTRLSSWTNGGGSVSAIPGLAVLIAQEMAVLPVFDTSSTFMG